MWRKVTGDISRGNSRQAKQSDREMREVMTHSAAGGKDVVHGGMNVRGRAIVTELTPHRADDAGCVARDVLRHLRARRPEELSQAAAEGDIAAGLEEIAILRGPRFVIGKILLEGHPARMLNRNLNPFDRRSRDDCQLAMRRFDRYRMRPVAEGVFVFGNFSGWIDLDLECDTALAGAVIGREPRVVLRIVRGLVVGIASSITNSKQHQATTTNAFLTERRDARYTQTEVDCARIRSAISSAIITVLRWVLARTISGMIEQSITRRPSRPITRQSGSTTDRESDAGPIRQVPAPCCESKQLARIHSSSAGPSGGFSLMAWAMRIGLPKPTRSAIEVIAGCRANSRSRRIPSRMRITSRSSLSIRKRNSGSISGEREVIRKVPRE